MMNAKLMRGIAILLIAIFMINCIVPVYASETNSIQIPVLQMVLKMMYPVFKLIGLSKFKMVSNTTEIYQNGTEEFKIEESNILGVKSVIKWSLDNDTIATFVDKDGNKVNNPTGNKVRVKGLATGKVKLKAIGIGVASLELNIKTATTEDTTPGKIVTIDGYTVTLQYSAKYNVSSKPLTKKLGKVSFNGHKETFYSQKRKPGNKLTKLNNNGRHVADDGTIRDGDGYIAVACNYLPQGATIMTSLGPGKVYDTGDMTGKWIDIYVNW